MNKNGFTLVEVLAIIILISLLTILITPNLLKLRNKVDDKRIEEVNDIIISKAKYYVSSNDLKNEIKSVSSGSKYVITLSDLEQNNYLEEDFSDVYDNPSNIIITVQYNDAVYNYEIIDNSENVCTYNIDSKTVKCNN